MVAESSTILRDISVAAQLVAKTSWRHIAHSWLYVPVGIILILLACFGVESLLNIGSIAFPSSVAGLIILFLALLLSERVFGEHRTRRMVAIVDIPGGWSLRWIGMLFTPSFVLLPLSPPIGIVEVSKIIAVFIIGFLIMMVLTAYMTRSLQLLFGSSKRAMTERAEELDQDTDEIPMTTTPRSEDATLTPATLSEAPSSVDVPNFDPPARTQSHPRVRTPGDSRPTTPGAGEEVTQSGLPRQAPPPPPRSSTWAAFIVSHLDILTYGFLFIFVGLPIYYAVGYAMPMQVSFSILAYFAALAIPPAWRQYLHPVLVSSLCTVLGLWVLGLAKGDSLYSSLTQYRTGTKYSVLLQAAIRPGAADAVSLPSPGAGDVLGSVLDASIVALALPMYQYRRELRTHLVAIVMPNVLVSVASLFAYPVLCYAIGIGAERSLAFAARSLTLALATPAAANLGGDANTVAALAIMSGILGVLVGQRMLGWLRIPEGVSLMAIAIALCPSLAVVRDDKADLCARRAELDDYVTRGVTLGANSSAIATALLLKTDPRAAALSSLSMGLFGTITVLFTSIPPITSAVRSLVGL